MLQIAVAVTDLLAALDLVVSTRLVLKKEERLVKGVKEARKKKSSK